MGRLSTILRHCRQIRPQHAVIVLCTTLVLAYGASALVALRRSHDQTLHDAIATIESMSRSIEVGTNRTIFEVDAMLLGVQETLSTVFPDMSLRDPSIRVLLRQLNDQTIAIRDILILDNQGWLLNSAGSTPMRPRNYADQAFFTAHQATEAPTLYIGPPQRSRATGGWSIMMSRPLMRGDTVIGIIAAEVPTSVFTDFFNAIVTTSRTRVSMLSDSGVLEASEPHREDLIGGHPAFASSLLAAAAKRRVGLIESSADDDGERMRSFRRVPARPLIIAVSRDRDDILRQWRGECLASAFAFILFAATAATLTSLVVRALNRQQHAVADLRAGEERLKRQSELLQSTLENMGEGLSVFDRQGHLIAWNTRFRELLDLPIELTPETTLTDILGVQAQRGDFGENYPDCEISDRAERFFSDVPTVRDRITGGGRTLQIRRRAMPDGGVVSLYSDITEGKAAEQTMVQARAQAELANRSKSDFLANMSHELRTPLNAIIGFSEILCGEHLGPLKNLRYQEYASDIHASGLHLLSIINDVLDMSKIEAGKFDVYEEAVSVRQLLASALRMVRVRARNLGVELVSQVTDSELVIWADERAIKQALLNVLSNAVKFSKGGGRVCVRAAVDATGATVFEIEDNGIGMSAEEKERALQPFGQAQSATTRTYGGIGLGLPITEGLVEAHGGVLTIDSELGEGTRVRITLPPERTRPARAKRLALRA